MALDARKVIIIVSYTPAPPGVTETALDCGYQSPAAFAEAFTRRFGVSPTRFAGRR